MELENIYFDTKYYFETVKKVEDPDMKMRLLNCLMFYRHFTQVLEKKVPDVFDPSTEVSLEQREATCLKYVRYE